MIRTQRDLRVPRGSTNAFLMFPKDSNDRPNLPAYDHEALAVKGHYNAGDLATAFAALVDSRRAIINTFKALTPEQWERTGIHPERGVFTMTDAALQTVEH